MTRLEAAELACIELFMLGEASQNQKAIGIKTLAFLMHMVEGVPSENTSIKAEQIFRRILLENNVK